MHILIISRGKPDDKSQYGIFEFDQARALARAGIQVSFFALDLRSIRHVRKFGFHAGKEDGVSWYRADVPVGAVPLPILIGIGSFVLRRLYRKVFKESCPDLIHAHFTHYGIMAVKLAEQEHLPFVITEHSSAINKENVEPNLLKYAEYAYSKADAVVAVSKSLALRIKEKTGVNCCIISNIVAIDDFYTVRRDPSKKGFGFVCCGNLVIGKRPVLLLEAFREVLAKYPDTYLGIIGDGPLYDELEKIVIASNLTEHVTIYGFLRRNQIAKQYSYYDCFVLPSASETFGVAFIEAMAAGLPVISTACGGPEDFVLPDNGLLIPVDDKDALIKALEQMILTREQYSSTLIRNYVRSNFSPNIVSNKLIELYSEVLGKRKIK